MLEERQIVQDTHSITFLFKLRTAVAPIKYIFEYKCRYFGSAEYYTERKKTISETVNYFTAGCLFPASQCHIRIVIVYHTGSLDQGLSYTVNTYLSR